MINNPLAAALDFALASFDRSPTPAATYHSALDAFNAAREALSERDPEAQYDHAVIVALKALEAASESVQAEVVTR